jgi:hypothetical protein
VAAAVWAAELIERAVKLAGEIIGADARAQTLTDVAMIAPDQARRRTRSGPNWSWRRVA